MSKINSIIAFLYLISIQVYSTMYAMCPLKLKVEYCKEDYPSWAHTMKRLDHTENKDNNCKQERQTPREIVDKVFSKSDQEWLYKECKLSANYRKMNCLYALKYLKFQNVYPELVVVLYKKPSGKEKFYWTMRNESVQFHCRILKRILKRRTQNRSYKPKHQKAIHFWD